MVRVPTWDTNIDTLPGASGVPHATADTFGAQIARATEASGRAIAHGLSQLGASLTEQANEQSAINAKVVTSDYEAAHNQYELTVKSNTDPSQIYTLPEKMRQWEQENWPTYEQRMGGKYGSIATANVHVFHNQKQTEYLRFLEQTKDKYIPLQIQSAAEKHYATVRQGGIGALAPSAAAVRSMIEESTSLDELQKRTLKLNAMNEFYNAAQAYLLDQAVQGKLDSEQGRAWAKEGMGQIKTLLGITELAPYGGGPVNQKRLSSANTSPLAPVIERAAQERGLNPDTAKVVAHIESNMGRTRDTPGSQYQGVFQLSPAEAKGANRADPVANIYAGVAALADKSAKFEAAHGRPPTAAELYLMHQQGEAGAAMHMANPDRPAWQNMLATGEGRQKGEAWAKKAIWGNIPDADKRRFGSVENVTSRDFMALWASKVEGGGTQPSPQSLVRVTPAPARQVAGMRVPGNIDLSNRPIVRNANGSVSTLRSISFTNEQGQAVLVPTVAHDGSSILSDQAALAQYRDTGKHLGIFDTEEAATDYAKALHEAQAAALDKVGADATAFSYGESLLTTPEGVPLVGSTRREQAAQDHAMVQWRQVEAQQRAQANAVRLILNKELQNESVAMKWARGGGQNGQNAAITGAVLDQIYGPAIAAIHKDRRNADLKFNAGPGSWTPDTTPEQMADDLVKMDPHNIDPQSPAFKHWVDNYQEASALMVKIIDTKNKLLTRKGHELMKGLIDTAHTKGQLSQGQIDEAKPFLTDTQLTAAYNLKDKPPTVKDAAVDMEIENQIRKMPPDQFQQFIIPFIARRNVSADEAGQYTRRNNEHWQQGVLPPVVSARKSLSEAMTPGAFGTGPESVIMRQKLDLALREFDDWAEAPANNPLLHDRAAVFAKRDEIERRYQLEGLADIKVRLGKSFYFPDGSTEKSITLDTVAAAEAKLKADIQGGKISPPQAATQWMILKDWGKVLSKEEASRAPAKPPAKVEQPQQPIQPPPPQQQPGPGLLDWLKKSLPQVR